MIEAVLALDHTAIAVRELGRALPLYRDLLGGKLIEQGYHPEQGFRSLLLRYPNGAGVELLEPIGESGFLQTFLEKYGEGPHHLTFLVGDVAAAAAAARAAGLRVVGESYDNPIWHECFISPRDANGTIVQLAYTPLDDDGRRAAWKPDAERIARLGGPE